MRAAHYNFIGIFRAFFDGYHIPESVYLRIAHEFFAALFNKFNYFAFIARYSAQAYKLF
jgi:hypothetical protein